MSSTFLHRAQWESLTPIVHFRVTTYKTLWERRHTSCLQNTMIISGHLTADMCPNGKHHVVLVPLNTPT